MITLHLPEGTTFDFEKEISDARNIQDKANRDSTIAGLHKIKQYI